MFVHCDALWDSAIDDADRLAARALVPGGVLVRLHPEESSVRGSQVSGTGHIQVRSPLSTEGSFSATAWIRLPENVPDIGYSRESAELAGNSLPELVPLQLAPLEVRMESIKAASSAPLTLEARGAQREAQQRAARAAEAKKEAEELDQIINQTANAVVERHNAVVEAEKEEKRRRAKKWATDATMGGSFVSMGNVKLGAYARGFARYGPGYD